MLSLLCYITMHTILSPYILYFIGTTLSLMAESLTEFISQNIFALKAIFFAFLAGVAYYACTTYVRRFFLWLSLKQFGPEPPLLPVAEPKVKQEI